MWFFPAYTVVGHIRSVPHMRRKNRNWVTWTMQCKCSLREAESLRSKDGQKLFRETGEISVRKGQGRRPLLDAHGLRALRRHCITHRQHSVIEYVILPGILPEVRSEEKWSGVWPSMVTHTRNLCSAFNPSKCTHTAVRSEQTHTNCEHKPGAANAVAPGAQLGVRCLAQGSHLSRGIEGGESAGYSINPHRQFLPDLRLEPATFGLQVRLSIH